MYRDQEVGQQLEEIITASLMELHKHKPGEYKTYIYSASFNLSAFCMALAMKKRCISLNTIHINASFCLLDKINMCFR